MAEKIALELDVQTGKAVSNLGDLEKATKQLNKTIDKSEKETQTLQQQFDSLNKEIEEAPVNIRAMNKQIQQYQAIALEAGRTSPLGKDAIRKAAALKDRYIDIQNEVNRLANDGVKLQAALDIGTTVVAGFTAFQGVMALSGVESEELRETMVKLQGAQSVLMGVETLRKNLEKESTIILVAKNTAEKANLALVKATTIANKALGLSTDATTKSFKLMRGALIATGIGAIIVLIGTLIANWDKVTKALSSTTAAQEAYNEASAKAIDSIGKELDAADKLQKVLKDDTKTREEKVQAVKDLQEEYPGLLDNVDAEKDGLIAVSEQLTKNIELIMIKAQLEALAELRQEKTKENLKLELEAQTGVNVGIMDHIATLQLSMTAQEMADAKTANSVEENKKFIDSIDDMVEALEAKKKASLEGGSSDAEEAKKEADRLKELEKQKKEATKKEAKRLKEIAAEEKKAAAEKAKMQKLADDLMLTARKEINKRRVIEEIETNNKLKEEEKSTLETLSGFYKAYYDKQREDAKKELERQIALEDAKLSLAADGVGALINLTTAFAKDNEKSQKRAFEINKRLQIAQAIIQTYQGANAIFAARAASPETILFPAAPFIAAGIAVANGLANVATISKQQFQSGNPGGGGNQAPDFSGGAGSAPQLSPVTNTSTIVPQEPTQVFVTETDITNTQNQVNVIQGQATLS
tara:strand:+ start:16807 stop:18900 length:2094 start_codon:yes stop_codon:yes gene_type:complete